MVFFPRVFFLYLDEATDFVPVLNKIFEFLAERFETNAWRGNIQQSEQCLVLLKFLDVDILKGSLEDEKFDHLSNILAEATFTLTRGQMIEYSEKAKYTLAMKTKKTETEASIIFYLKNIEQK